MENTLPFAIFYGFIISSFVSFSRAFSHRVSEAFYGKQRKTISDKWRYILYGRSRCDFCSRDLGFPWILPLAGYLLSHGKCRHCGEKIPRVHIFEEALGFFTGALVFYLFKEDLAFLAIFPLYLVVCYFIGFIDYRHFLIPGRSLAFLFAVSILDYTLEIGQNDVALASVILKFLIPFCWFLFFYLIVYLQPDKMGHADIYTVAATTFACEFPASLLLPGFASFLAILYFLTRYRKLSWQEARKNKIPLGLFLSLALVFMKIIPFQDFLT